MYNELYFAVLVDSFWEYSVATETNYANGFNFAMYAAAFVFCDMKFEHRFYQGTITCKNTSYSFAVFDSDTAQRLVNNVVYSAKKCLGSWTTTIMKALLAIEVARQSRSKATMVKRWLPTRCLSLTWKETLFMKLVTLCPKLFSLQAQCAICLYCRLCTAPMNTTAINIITKLWSACDEFLALFHFQLRFSVYVYSPFDPSFSIPQTCTV